MTEQYSIIYTSLILHGARLETQAMKNWRQKGRYGGRKGWGEVGGERREGERKERKNSTHLMFTPSSTDGHLGCCQLCVIVNNAAMNMAYKCQTDL